MLLGLFVTVFSAIAVLAYIQNKATERRFYDVGEMFANLVPNIQKTADLVQEISAASNEQTSSTD